MNYVERPGEPIFRHGRRIEIIELVSSSSSGAKVKWKRVYTVVPYTWEVGLRGCRAVSTYKLAMHLLYAHWYNGGRPIRLANVGLVATGVGRNEKRRGLVYLEGKGLISIERRPRKSPLIACLQMEGCPVKGTG